VRVRLVTLRVTSLGIGIGAGQAVRVRARDAARHLAGMGGCCRS
jgi:hypothetical protein